MTPQAKAAPYHCLVAMGLIGFGEQLHGIFAFESGG